MGLAWREVYEVEASIAEVNSNYILQEFEKTLSLRSELELRPTVD
jgi:hypothetical protein